MALDAAYMLAASPKERLRMIESELPLNYIPEGATKEIRGLNKARDYSNIINSFIVEYIEIMIKKDITSESGSILEPQNLNIQFSKVMDNWKNTKGKDSISKIELKQNPYTMVGANLLANANAVTRSLSTKMGELWELLAQMSPYAINPEIEFDGLKIQGIDLIALNYNTHILEYIQLKTKRDTLTGSQSPRSKTELSIHDNPVFCAAFDLGPWNFNSEEIPRVCGAEFWERIGIEYDIFTELVKEMILGLELMFKDHS